MGKSYNFKDLKKYATKIYKFKQGKSIEVLKDSLSGGGQAMTTAHFTNDEFNDIPERRLHLCQPALKRADLNGSREPIIVPGKRESSLSERPQGESS